MKKYFSSLSALFLLVTIAFSFPQTASAHLIEMDKNVHGEIHFEPGDEFPVAGQETSYYFHFEDIAKKIKLQECDCTLSVWQNEKELFSQPLDPYSGVEKSFNFMKHFTLPAIGKYDLKVVGKPIKPATFPPFEIVWDIESKESVPASPVVQTAPSSAPVLVDSPVQMRTVNWQFYALAGVSGTALLISAGLLVYFLRKK